MNEREIEGEIENNDGWIKFMKKNTFAFKGKQEGKRGRQVMRQSETN